MNDYFLAEEISNQYESNVRYYSRHFTDVFVSARGSFLHGASGYRYMDFFSGAGSLNYGHNHPLLKQAVLDYVMQDGVMQCLDMHTEPKLAFLTQFQEKILKPRGLNYKLMFTGPTGANAVEAALKLARSARRQRPNIFYCTHAYHGLSLGALTVTDLEDKKQRLGMHFPYVRKIGFNRTKNLVSLLEKEKPAGIILETLQAEGGLNIASKEWLQEVAYLAQKYDAMCIVDDIQVGCGRVGRFFSFEDLGIVPDLVCLSKSLSGFGYPLSMLMIKPECDVFLPGEHTGTFRANALSLVTAKKALSFWEDQAFMLDLQEKIGLLQQGLQDMVQSFPKLSLTHKGKGMIQGLEFNQHDMAEQIRAQAFSKHLLLETCGRQSQVLKCMPALTIDQGHLIDGLDIIRQLLADLETRL